ncbi:MAG: hypothetical protein KatS3mg028_1082 [Bacteroidia bacterium]|nr:MAG: hypothetical protein KatS3mg028_1082 [Bacteroidia bacterium]
MVMGMGGTPSYNGNSWSLGWIIYVNGVPLSGFCAQSVGGPYWFKLCQTNPSGTGGMYYNGSTTIFNLSSGFGCSYPSIMIKENGSICIYDNSTGQDHALIIFYQVK